MTATGQAGTATFPFGALTLHAAPVWATATSNSVTFRTRSPELLRKGFTLQKEIEHAQATKPLRCGRQPTSNASPDANQTAASVCGPHVSGKTRRSDQFACG